MNSDDVMRSKQANGNQKIVQKNEGMEEVSISLTKKCKVIHKRPNLDFQVKMFGWLICVTQERAELQTVPANTQFFREKSLFS